MLDKDENKTSNEHYGLFKAKKNELAVKLTETKSVRKLDLLEVEGMQVDDVKEEEFLPGYVGKESNFSFKEKRESREQSKNVHEISIDNFLECREGSFRL